MGARCQARIAHTARVGQHTEGDTMNNRNIQDAALYAVAILALVVIFTTGG